MSVTCQKCSAIVFGGHECIRCGHLSPAPTAVAEESAQAAPASAGPAGEPKGKKVLLGAGAVIAAVALIGGALFGLSKMEESATDRLETEAELAFTEAEAKPVVLDASFCRSPQAITDAPTPTDAGPNAIASFERPGLQWEKAEESYFDPLYFASDRDRFEIDADNEIEAVYAMCLDSVGSGTDRTCTGYEGNAKYVIAGMTHTASVYELATADLVLETEIGSARTVCPGVILSGSRGAQDVNGYELAGVVSGLAAPAQYTKFHFFDDLNGLYSSWCANPKAIPEAGTKAETPMTFVLGGNGEKMDEYFPDNNFERYDDFSHIGCLEFQPSEEEPRVCDYNQTGSFKVKRGAYVATIVEAATGTVVASAGFEGNVGCPITVLTYSGWDKTRDASAPDEAYAYIADTMAAPEQSSTPEDD